MRKDLPTVIASIDLNAQPIADTLKTILQISATMQPQGINAEKSTQYATHIYNEFFAGKETNYVFFATLAKLLALASDEVEKKFGIDIPQAILPKIKKP